jgi:hypothetical protein
MLTRRLETYFCNVDVRARACERNPDVFMTYHIIIVPISKQYSNGTLHPILPALTQPNNASADRQPRTEWRMQVRNNHQNSSRLLVSYKGKAYADGGPH